MRGFSLTQPYADLVVRRFKRFETRSWWTSYRGPVAIIVAARGLPASAGRGIAACLLRIRVGSCKVSSGVQ